MQEMQTLDWITAFDWEHADAQARSSAALSARLLAALRERSSTTGELARTAEATEFGRYVEALRRARGWSRPQLAEQAGIDPLAVPLLEQAALTRQELSPGLVSRLARAFNIPIEALQVNPAPQRPAAAPRRFGQWLRQLLARGNTAASAPSGSVPMQAPRAARRPAAPAPLQAASPAPAEAAPPAPMQAMPPAVARTTYFAARAQSAPVPPDLHAAREMALAPGAMAFDLGEAQLPTLSQPLALPDQEVRLPGGQVVRVALTLQPGRPPRPGMSDLQVQLLDSQGSPLAGQGVSLDLDGVLFAGSSPTDRAGVSTIPNLPLAALAEVDALTVRLT